MSPAVAVMTNIYPDHLDTYDGMEDYAAAKANIFRHQPAVKENHERLARGFALVTVQ